MVDFSEEKHLILLIVSFDIVDHVVFGRKLCLLALPASIFNWIDSVFITRSSPGDDLVDWNSGVSDRPSAVRTSVRSPTSVRPQEVFSDFDLIWCVDRPRPDMRNSATSTRSKVKYKVKVKVTELPNLRKLHFSRSISSAVLAWSSKLMVGGDSMGPGIQLIGARFLNFIYESYNESSNFAACRYFTKYKWPYFGSA